MTDSQLLRQGDHVTVTTADESHPEVVGLGGCYPSMGAAARGEATVAVAFDRDLFTSRSVQDWHLEEVARAYAYGRQDERFWPGGFATSGAFAEATRGAGVGDFKAIYDRLAAGTTEAEKDVA